MTPNCLAEIIVEVITGYKVHSPKVININSKHLSTRGDLSFQLGLDYWRGYINVESDWFKYSKNILQYYMHRNLNEIATLSDGRIFELLKKHVIDMYQTNNVRNISNPLITMNISKNFVLINFKRSIVACAAVKSVIEQGNHFGERPHSKEKFHFEVEYDEDSEITNMRLNLLKKVSTNLLKFQGYNVQNEVCEKKYIYTIKSQSSNVDDSFNRYLCGPVLNSNKKKEKALTQDEYLQRKIKKVQELNTQKYSNFSVNKDNKEGDFLKIANASIIYELLSTKLSSPIIIELSDDLDRSIKESSFILYNNVRISAILDKYAKLVSENKFPQILPIENIECFKKIVDEESWSLIYNYIIKYPDILKSVVTVEQKLEINIQLFWSFISNLCHDFSKYYRKNRILIKGVNSNEQITILTTERLHMLRALQNILRISLSLLEVEEVLYM